METPQTKTGPRDNQQIRRPVSQTERGRTSHTAPPLIRPVIAPRLTNPALPTPRLPHTRFQLFEEQIMEGLDFLGQSPPDVPAAAKRLASLQNDELAGELPERLKCRLRFFKDSLERIRKDLIREWIDREIKLIEPVLKLKSPCTERVAEGLQAAEVLLKAAPDPQLETKVEYLRRELSNCKSKPPRSRKPLAKVKHRLVPIVSTLVMLAGAVFATASLWPANRTEKIIYSTPDLPASASTIHAAVSNPSGSSSGTQLLKRASDPNASILPFVGNTAPASMLSSGGTDNDPISSSQPTIEPAALRLKVQPEDATYTVVYPGHKPRIVRNTNYIAGLEPNAEFKLITERSRFVSLTNTFKLNPGQILDCNLGRMEPSLAKLSVLALPQPFQLIVEWDGMPHDFGMGGEAVGLPPGKSLIATVAAEGCELWSTNVVLDPGEARTISLGRLPAAQGFLVLNSATPGGIVSYRVDGGAEIVLGVTDTIPSLPIGHQVTVTVGKPGFISVTKGCLFQRSGELLDMGSLKPSADFLGEQMFKAAQSGDINTIEKILSSYSTDYPLLVDQPAPNESDAPTPLLDAVRKGHSKLVQFLIKSGANVNRANRYRVTPLFEAARKGNVEIVRNLLDAHADVGFRNLSGQTPIFAVVLSSRNVEVANLLMAFGANPNVRDLSGETPVLLAEENQSNDILQVLVHPPVKVARQP